MEPLDPSNRVVYVVLFNPEFDYTDAERYGTICYMLKGFMVGKSTKELHHIFCQFAKTAKESDYLLLSGSNLVCALATAAWSKQFNSVNLLSMRAKKNKTTQETNLIYDLHNVTITQPTQVQEDRL